MAKKCLIPPASFRKLKEKRKELAACALAGTGHTSKMSQQERNFNYDPDIEDPDDIAVTLEFEDGTEQEFGVLTIFTIEGERPQDYIALLPYDEKGEFDFDEPAILYRYFEETENEPRLELIDDEEEYKEAEQVFFDIMESED